MTNSMAFEENPYIIGRPIYEPQYFFGREDIFQFLQENLRQRVRVILLHGQRRIGKSSVLAQIPNFIKLDQFVFIPLSLEGKSQKSLNAVLRELAIDIKDYLTHELGISESKISLPSKQEFRDNYEIFSECFLPSIYEFLENKSLVLLIDEFDVLGDSFEESAANHFFPYLQSILHQHHRLFIVPFVGRQLTDLPNLLNLFGAAPYLGIDLLKGESAERLITEPARGILEYETDAIEAILELSGGHPYFTQVLCFAIFSQSIEKKRRHVERRDVESIVGEAIEFGEGGLAWFRDGLPIAERVFFSAAAEAQSLTEIRTNSSKLYSSASQTSNTSIHMQLSEQQIYESLKYQWLTIAISSSDKLVVPKDLISLKLPEFINTDIGIIVTGRAPIWLYSYLMRTLPDIVWIASYDPRFGAVVVSTQSQEVHTGQILPLGLPDEESQGVSPLRLLEEHGIIKTIDLTEAGERLVNWGFLDFTQDSKNYIYKVKIDLVRRWLAKRHPLPQEIWELEKLNPKAEQIYQKAREINQQGEVAEAIELYNLVLEANPNYLSALFDLASGCLEIEDFSRAAELYARAYRVDSVRNQESYVQALLGYSRDLRLQKDFELAKAQLTKALDVNSDNDAIHSLLTFITHEIENG